MRERLRQGRTLLAASALAALVLLAAAQPPLPPLTATENRVVFYTCRDHEDNGVQQNSAFANEVKSEITYVCGSTAIADTADRGFQIKEHQAAEKVVAPFKAAEGDQCPSTAAGTSLAVKALLNASYSAAVYGTASNYADEDFREMVQGIAWPAVGGGVIAQTARLEVFTKPTVQDYVTDFVTGGRYPHPFGSDTKAVVASFQAPAPPTQAAFFFHATETFNPCMWATDADFSQVSYEPANGQPPCPGCMVHKGFTRAFGSVTNANNATYNIAEIWRKMTGVAPTAVTTVLCAGHSLGAAMATLCGPWAKAVFPNAAVTTVVTGAPRVFNPAAAAWYDALMGATTTTRIVNNMDVVPSLPPEMSFPLGSYRHVGSVLWLDRTGEFMPGNYTAFAQARPGWYTGSTYDHHGYLMAMKQALICNPAF